MIMQILNVKNPLSNNKNKKLVAPVFADKEIVVVS